jgi:hypothetical protein
MGMRSVEFILVQTHNLSTILVQMSLPGAMYRKKTTQRVVFRQWAQQVKHFRQSTNTSDNPIS